MTDTLINDCQKHRTFTTTPGLIGRINEQKHDGWISRYCHQGVIV